MSVAVLFLVIGLLLIALLTLVSLRIRSADQVSPELPNSDEAAPAFRADVPRQELSERLFGSEDSEFVASQGSDQLKLLFRRQRTALALSWIAEVRRGTAKLMHVHRLSARTSSQLEPLAELRVAANYFLLMFFCRFGALAIWLHGPAGLSGMIRGVDGLSSRLSQIIYTVLPTGQGEEGKIAVTPSFK